MSYLLYLTALVAVVSAVTANAVVAVDSNRNVLTVETPNCKPPLCAATTKFSAIGLCVKSNSNSSYIATCNVSTGAFTLQQFLGANCTGEQFRNVSSESKDYIGNESNWRFPYQNAGRSVAAKLCNGACTGTCEDAGPSSDNFRCYRKTLFGREYVVTGAYSIFTSDMARSVYISVTECQHQRLPLFYGKANNTGQCVSYTPTYSTMCTPVTQTVSPVATATATAQSTASFTATKQPSATASVQEPATPTATQTLQRPATRTATPPIQQPITRTATAMIHKPTTATVTTNNSVIAALRGDAGGNNTDTGSNRGVCVWCIVVPIVLLLLLLLCIILLIWLLCCRRPKEVKVLDDVEAIPNPLGAGNNECYYPDTGAKTTDAAQPADATG